MQFLAYSASADGQRHRLRGRTADFLAESSVRTGTLKKDRNVLNGRPSTIHLRAKGQRRVTSASLSPRFGTPDLLDEDELPCARPGGGGSTASLRGPRICTSAVTAAFVAAWRVSRACGRACVARPSARPRAPALLS